MRWPARLAAFTGSLLGGMPGPSTVQVVGDVYLDIIAKIDELPEWDGDSSIRSPIETVAFPKNSSGSPPPRRFHTSTAILASSP